MDKKTADKGWAAMREMLDREMPEKPSQRLGWWWLGLLLLPIAGYGSWKWHEAANGRPQEQVPVVVQPMEGNHLVKDNDSIQPIENQQLKTDASSTSAPLALLATNQKSIPADKKDRYLRVHHISSPEYGHFEPEKMPSTLVSAPQVQERPASPAQERLPIEHLPVVTSEIQGRPALFRHSIAVGPKPVKKSPPQTWAFGASSAISTEQFNSINGFSTGLTADWNFAREWGLRMGAYYNIHTPQEKYRPVASVRSTDYRSNVYGDVIVVDYTTGVEVSNITGNSSFGDSLAGNVFIPVNRLQRLEVPLAVFWQAARPLKVLGGLSLSRTLSAKAARQNYSGEYILKLADRTAEDGASKLSYSELDNWSADAMLGAGVRLGSLFEISLSARMPLSKFPGLSKNNQVGTTALADQSLGSTRKQTGPVFSLCGTLFF